VTACVPAERLGALLRGQLDEAARAEVEAHVEACSVCQAALDRLSADPGDVSTSRVLSVAQEDEEFLRRLKEEGPPSAPGQAGSRMVSPRRPDWNLQRFPAIPGFRIVREVGRGGMGVVYEAVEVALNRRVALKVLSPQSAAHGTAVARFRREARAAAQLHHTNIVPVHGFGEDGGHLYYAMQLIDGEGLDRVLARAGRCFGTTDEALTTAAAEGQPASRTRSARVAAPEPTLAAPTTAERAVNDAPAREESAGVVSEAPAAGPDLARLASEATSRKYALALARLGLQVACALEHAHA
jgi:hypothetical protein